MERRKPLVESSYAADPSSFRRRGSHEEKYPFAATSAEVRELLDVAKDANGPVSEVELRAVIAAFLLANEPML